MHGRIFLWSILFIYLFIWWVNYETLACPINIYNASWSIYIVEHRELLQYVCWKGEGSLLGQAIWNHYLGAICFTLIFWKLFFIFFYLLLENLINLKYFLIKKNWFSFQKNNIFLLFWVKNTFYKLWKNKNNLFIYWLYQI
jgi:hypothetical protein